MRRPDKGGGKAVKPQRQRTLKRRNAEKAGRKLPAIDAAEKIALLEHRLNEALEQQSATSEILRVIASSPTETQSVLDTIVATAARLLDVADAYIMRVEGQLLKNVSMHGPSPQWVIGTTRAINRDWVTGRAVVDRKPVHVRDLQAAQREFPEGAAYAKHYGHRTTLATPLLREGKPVGAFLIRRNEVKPFTNKQIELLQNFASQAVIAIENTRLLNELRKRTDDLSESLERQTATSKVLQVISSSPGQLNPVFNAVLENAVRICGAKFGVLYLVEDDGCHTVAMHDVPKRFAEKRSRTPFFKPPPGGKSPMGRVMATRQVAQIDDITQGLLEGDQALADLAELGGARTVLAVPMLKDADLVGGIVIYRQEVRRFTEKQIELVQNFAAQAVIAIENTRLLNELRESLQQQTATADVLKIISSSPGELGPVFQAMLEQATHICEAKFGLVVRYEDGLFHPAATLDLPPALADFMVRQGAFAPKPGQLFGRLCESKTVINVIDRASDPEPSPSFRYGGARSSIAVPMLKDDELLGAFFIYRTEVRPFTDKQIELVKNFAAQAVIAIENTRLLSELRESLQQQTATADVLKVIASSTGELAPVFNTILENAAHICEAKFGALLLFEDGKFRMVAMHNVPAAFAEVRKREPVFAPGPSNNLVLAVQNKAAQHVPDIRLHRSYIEREPAAVAIADVAGARTLVVVPMLKDNDPIGAIAIYREEVRPFTDNQIELVKNFAAQGVIAIENARLLSELRERTHELAASLDDLRTTQDRLVQTQKLALLGQLTAGIAHEIKNPLNFVNNFSGISAELIDELQGTLKGISLDDRARTEINELTDTLRSNFDKVVHHGRRADAIVKNMLQHSREGSGEHRVIDINALVEESLNLAWHGARAETQGFEIKLKQFFDPSAGGADVFPQDVRRALLNLIANGFYAATRRRAKTNGGDYEPTLTASTKNLGDRVEVRIRDNGTGMTPDVKEKMFNPFFTTKPTGQGTGLGLSISHDVIVKQHAGTIEVDSQPGEFTEIRIVLPRRAAFV